MSVRTEDLYLQEHNLGPDGEECDGRRARSLERTKVQRKKHETAHKYLYQMPWDIVGRLLPETGTT